MSKRKSKKIPAITVMSTLAVTALASSVSADTIIRNSTLNGLQVSSGASSAYIYAQGKDTRISNDVVIKAPTTLTANSDATNPFKDARVVIETNGTVTIGVPLKEVYINSNATIKLTGGGSIQRVVIASGKNPTLPPGIPGSVTQLATPSKPTVSGTRVSWGAVANATKYTVTIYNDKNTEVKTVSNVASTSVDLSAQSLAAGTYTVRVKAIGNGSTYSDSALSVASSAVTITSPTTQLATPGNLTVSGTTVSWGAVTNATKYAVAIYNDKNTEVKTVSNVASTSVDLSAQNLAAGTYTVRVKAIGNGSTYSDSALSATSSTITIASPVTQLAAPGNLTVSGTKVSWDAVTNATKYAVTIYDDKNAEVKTVSDVASTSVDLSAQSLAAGTYTVKVKAIGNGSTYSDSALSSASSAVTIASPVTQLAAPGNLTVSGTKVSWDAVTNATKYAVTIYDDKNAEVKTVSDVASTSVDLSAQSLAAGTYTVKVKAIGNGSTYSDSALSSASSAVTIASPVTQLAAPGNLTVSGTKVSWDAVTNATKYAVTIYDDKNAEVKTVSDVASTSVDLSAQSLAAGTYTVKVKAIGNGSTYSDSALSSASSAVTIASPVTQLAAPGNLTVSGTTVSWGAVTNATKYAVAIYDDKNAEVKTVSNVASTSIDLSAQSLAAGTYTVKVKAIGNGTTYSDSALSSASSAVTIAAVDKSAATVGLEAPGDKTAGEAFNLSITGAKDKDGNALSKAAKIKVVANNGTSDTPVVNDQSFTFTSGAVKVPVTIGNVGTYTLKVTIEGVTGEKTVSNVTVK